MRHHVKRALQVGLGSFLLLSGAGFIGIPDHEVSYSFDPPLRVCSSAAECLVNYELVVGNTGWLEQEGVQVVVDSDVLQNLIREPQVRTVSGKRRDIFFEDLGGTTRIHLPSIERGRVLRLHFARQEPRRIDEPTFGKFLREVRPARGAAVHAPPRGVTFARFLFAIFSV